MRWWGQLTAAYGTALNLLVAGGGWTRTAEESGAGGCTLTSPAGAVSEMRNTSSEVRIWKRARQRVFWFIINLIFAMHTEYN